MLTGGASGLPKSIPAARRYDQVGAWYWLAVAAIVALAIAIRCIGIQSRWMWLDEIMSATYASADVLTTLATALRFDVHPPFYYLQLSLWEMAGRDDVWLMLNGVFWSVAAVVLLIHLARRRYGWRVAITAGLLFAVAPATLPYADQVRMYGFLTLPLLWTWYAQQRWVEQPSLGATLALLVSQLMVIYSHTAGIVMVSGCVVLGGMLVLRTGSRRLLLHWLAAEAAVGVIAVPALAIAFMRVVKHISLPGAWDVLATGTFLVTGVHTVSGPEPIVALVMLILLVAVGLRAREQGIATAIIVLVPMALALTISYLKSPIWIDRIFVPMLPFPCLLLAHGLAPHPPARPSSLRIAGLVALIAAGGSAAIASQPTRHKGDGYRPAALQVHNMVHPGDLVVLTDTFDYWCFMWYYAGPNWGRPLHTYILTEEWRRMSTRLPPRFAAWLGLDAQDGEHLVDGIQVVLHDSGVSGAPLPPVAGAVITVTQTPLGLVDVPGRQLADRFQEQELTIERWVPNKTP
jgi:mannosyltransferase